MIESRKINLLILTPLVVLIFLRYLNTVIYYNLVGEESKAILIGFGFYIVAFISWTIKGNFQKLPLFYCGSLLCISLMTFVWNSILFDVYSIGASKNMLSTIVNILFLALAMNVLFKIKFNFRLMFAFFAAAASVFNMLDFFDQGLYFEQVEGNGIRAAGYYINSNAAAEAILIGMALGTSAVKNRFKGGFIFICLIGILLSFSRGGVIGWFLVVLLLQYTQALKVSNSILIMIGIGLLLYWLSMYFDNLSNYTNLDLLASRIDFISGINIYSAKEDDRFYLVMEALSKFSDSPFIGLGPYSLNRLGSDQLSHNVYLHFLTDNGLLGLLLYGVLLLAIHPFSSGRRELVPYFGFLLFWGFFSHNILDSYASLIALTYVATRVVHIKSLCK
jgi:O-antigen ligase